MPLHRGHVDCILRAASQCEKLYVVLMYNGAQELEIVQRGCKLGCDILTPHIRELALRREFNDFPNIEVVPYDCYPADKRALDEGKHPWYYECEDMVSLMGNFDACYSSEEGYDELFQYFYPFADSIVLDPLRLRFPISGTQLRDMPFYAAYPHMARSYQQLVNKTVLCVGTCSCGKTTLVHKLASLFGTTYSSEQGRLVSQSFKNITSPGAEYYNEFICSQYMDNLRAKDLANMVAFLDTDAAITRFYSRLYEGCELKSADGIFEDTDYDLVLFFEPTVPFVEDGMRTHREEEKRWELSDDLLRVYKQRFGDKVKVLNGDYHKNYIDAVHYVEQLIGGDVDGA